MKQPLEAVPGLQRLSLVGGVFYVHHSPPPAPEPEPEPEVIDPVPEPELKLEAVAADAAPQPEPEPEPEPERSEPSVWGASYQLVPQGYGIEFGTGRLVPLKYMMDGVRVRPPAVR